MKTIGLVRKLILLTTYQGVDDMEGKTHSPSRTKEREQFLVKMAQRMFEAEAEFRRDTNQNGTFFFGLIKVCLEYLQRNGKTFPKEDSWYIPPASPAMEGNFSAQLFFESRLLLDVLNFSSSSTENLGIIAIFLEKHVVPAFTEQFRLQLIFMDSSASQSKVVPW